jgi:hypothetical protein
MTPPCICVRQKWKSGYEGVKVQVGPPGDCYPGVLTDPACTDQVVAGELARSLNGLQTPCKQTVFLALFYASVAFRLQGLISFSTPQKKKIILQCFSQEW